MGAASLAGFASTARPLASRPRRPRAPEAASGLVHVRPGLLTPGAKNAWWDITAFDGPEKDAEIGQQIRSLVEETALPFFDRFPNESAMAEFLSQPRRREDRFIDPRVESLGLVYAGIIWHQLAIVDKCRDCMDRAAEKAKGKRLEADVERFAQAFVCDHNGDEKGASA